mgnify:CR=1 FL=1
MFVVVRHTRGGDSFKQVIYVKDYAHKWARESAMNYAEEIASQAALDYGYGSASVFKAKLILNSKPEKP